MLTLNAAIRPEACPNGPRIGLAIAGGGPLGAIYELGALQALHEGIRGLRLHQLDTYVGVSAGAFLATSLANQVTTAQMCRIFMGAPGAEFEFEPEHFLRPAFGEFARRAANLPGALLDLVIEAVRHPSRLARLEAIGGLNRVLPTGVFDNNTIHEFVARVLDRAGRSNDFRELETRLRIVAMDLDTGAAVRFGEPGLDDVPISRAVQASAALPGLYPPVKINNRYYVDGALRRTLHASVALNDGVDLLIGINPLVPYDSKRLHDSKHTVSESRMIAGGLPLVLSQTFRSVIQSRMQIGIAKYETQFPRASILLVEPNRNDERIFFTNMFSYSSRAELAEHAYQITRAELLARANELEAFLQRFDLAPDRDALAEPRKLTDSLRNEPAWLAPVGNSLARGLERLDRALTELA
ncbi:MAG: patatin-like phospholipase family protein [Wenzhouxiangellaceae bacterium]|nr:patatin-like phospholipase family protein [Wenzhouxiangellaceae bacterium]